MSETRKLEVQVPIDADDRRVKNAILGVVPSARIVEQAAPEPPKPAQNESREVLEYRNLED